MPRKTDNTIKLYRELMKGITLEEVNLPKQDKNPEEYREFCRYANMVYTNPYFELIRRQILLTQVSKTLLDSTCHEETQFGRAVVNGLALVEEIFKTYSLEFEAKFLVRKEDFNPSKGFESVSE